MKLKDEYPDKTSNGTAMLDRLARLFYISWRECKLSQKIDTYYTRINSIWALSCERQISKAWSLPSSSSIGFNIYGVVQL